MAYQALLCFCFATLSYGQLLEGDSGEFTLTSSALTLGKVTYVEIVSNKLYYPNVSLQIQLEDITLNHKDGDLLIIGPGSQKDVFLNAPGVIFMESQKETHTYRVIGKNACVVFIPQGLSKDRQVKIKWKRFGIETKEPPTTQLPTTPVSEADRQAIILCFKNKTITCSKFENPHTERSFKVGLADVANRYAQKTKFELARKIISSDIKTTCKEVCDKIADNNRNYTGQCEKTFLIVTITDRWNPELPVFSTEQLRSIISEFHTDQSLGVVECRTYPDYSWWLWGCGIMLVIIIIITVLCCKYSNYDSLCMDDFEEKPKKDPRNGHTNPGFVGDYGDLYEWDNDRVETSPPTTPTENLATMVTTTTTDGALHTSVNNPRGTPNLNTSRKLQTAPPIDPVFQSGMIPHGTPKMNLSRKLNMIPPTVTEDLLLATEGRSPVLPRSQLLSPKKPDPDAVSRASSHHYEDLDYLRLKIRQPSPSLSLRKQDDFDIDEDTEL